MIQPLYKSYFASSWKLPGITVWSELGQDSSHANRHSDDICEPSGSLIKTTDTVKHLGGILTATGFKTPAVIARIGEAKASVKNLEAVWRHTGLTKDHKLEI